MPNELDFPRRLMVVALSAAFPVHAYAQQPAVARVDFASGNVTAVAPGGTSRPVTRGSEIRVGETVNTQEGRAQMRFTDGAFVSLQPQTEFKVENYVFEGRSTQNESALMNLIKGGMRTITGLIGKTNRDGYKLQTSTATVGIRGTEFTVSYNADGSITAFVAGGAISVANQAGTTVVPGGRSVSVSSPSSAPQTTDEKPFLPPSGSTPTQIAVQSNVVQDAAPPIFFQPLLTGDVPGAGIAFHDPTNLYPEAVGPYKATYFCEGPCTTYDYKSLASLNAAGGLTSYAYTVSEGSPFDPNVYTLTTLVTSGTAEVIPGGRAENIALTGGGTATVTTSLAGGAPNGNDGVIAWGEWTNGTITRARSYDTNGVVTQTYIDSIDLRGTVPALYVVGAPAVMPSSGSAQYLMMGAITSCAPNCTAAVLGSKIEVDFGALTGSQTTLMQIGAGQDVFHSALYFNPGWDFRTGQGSYQPNTPSPLFYTYAYSQLSGSSRYFVGKGFFAGDNASRAGMSFTVEDSNLTGQQATTTNQASYAYGYNNNYYPITGVIAYKTSGTFGDELYSTTTLAPGSLGRIVDRPEMAFASNGDTWANYRDTPYSRAVINPQGGLFAFEDGYDYSVTPVSSNGSSAIQTTGNDGIIAWGRWVNARTTLGDNLSEQTAMHYLVGMPATNMPASGTFDFNQIGHSVSCNSLCTTASVSSSMRVDYGNLNASALNLQLTLDGTKVLSTAGYEGANGPAGLTFNGTRFSINGGTTVGSVDGVHVLNLNGVGFLAGNQAAGSTGARAGLAFSATGSNNAGVLNTMGYGSAGSVNGVIAYTRGGQVILP